MLGGGVSGRLFLDVREKRSLAYNTRSSLGELAKGPVPLVAYAGTQTAKTGLALAGLLDNLKRISTEPAGEEEMNTARRYLADIFAVKMETVGSVADMVVALAVLGLARRLLRRLPRRGTQVSADDAQKAMSEHVREGHVVIAVAGDAEKIGPVLSISATWSSSTRKRSSKRSAPSPRIPRPRSSSNASGAVGRGPYPLVLGIQGPAEIAPVRVRG